MDDKDKKINEINFEKDIKHQCCSTRGNKCSIIWLELILPKYFFEFPVKNNILINIKLG
jgi:hypothetical protein